MKRYKNSGYFVTMEGEVFSTRRGGMRRLKATKYSNGYHVVCLYTDDGKERFLLHRLVLEVFTGQSSMGRHGCHLNGDKSDNSLANLRWDTPAGNAKDNIANGTRLVGQQLVWTKLKEPQVLQIKEMAQEGLVSQRKIAQMFHVSQRTVLDIKQGRTWAWL
jgi:hypothetical protein